MHNYYKLRSKGAWGSLDISDVQGAEKAAFLNVENEGLSMGPIDPLEKPLSIILVEMRILFSRTLRGGVSSIPSGLVGYQPLGHNSLQIHEF